MLTLSNIFYILTDKCISWSCSTPSLVITNPGPGDLQGAQAFVTAQHYHTAIEIVKARQLSSWVRCVSGAGLKDQGWRIADCKVVGRGQNTEWLYTSLIKSNLSLSLSQGVWPDDQYLMTDTPILMVYTQQQHWEEAEVMPWIECQLSPLHCYCSFSLSHTS